MGQRESLDFDVVIVGGGPAGLGAAIRLKQLANAAGAELSVCLVEKGAEIGAHILSGAILEPRAIDELLPGWRDTGAPGGTPVVEDRLLFLTERRAVPLLVTPQMHNVGNSIVSLGTLCRWLGERAADLGVEVFPGFAGAEVLYDASGRVAGVATGDMGVGRDGAPTAGYTPGVELRARQTIFAEGCRGSLTKALFARFGLRDGVQPQTYGLGIKELWEIDPAAARPGLVVHSIGWPLDRATYGGSFLYHLEGNLVSVGLVVGLDYPNPWLSPFEEFQRLKTHPAIARHLAGGRRIAYGARAISEGGFQSIPRLTFPGGLIVGDAAGFLNMPKIKGSHTAMKSGMVAAEAVFAALRDGGDGGGGEVTAYPALLKASWLWDELYRARNIRPGFRRGLVAGIANAALDTYVLRGRAPWTLAHHEDHAALLPAAKAKKIDYPKPDGVLTFDRLSSVYLSNTHHEENQPVHLRLADPDAAIRVNLDRYAAPETRYCPAGVYETIAAADGPRLQINAQNCLHCKTCDIKDPTQNITWSVPEGGGGPNYPGM